MSRYSLSHLDDAVLERRVERINGHGFRFTAWELAHIAEYDARRLFVPKGFPSMSSYCVGHLRLSTDAAYKRIHAGRAARQFPAIFDLIAAGRLHLCGATELAPYLTPENAAELLEAATHRTVMEIRVLLRERFPRPDLPARLEALGSGAGSPELATSQVEPTANGHPAGACQLATSQVGALRPRVEPLSAGRYGLQLTIGQGAHDNLRYAQALLGHAVPSGDLAQVFERALDALITQLEKQKFAATSRPGRQRSSADPRHIPALVKRTVWERDGAQCTFVSDAGQRCPARTRLEYDHVDPVARGGEATVDGIRIRCRAHNQYEAECTFGVGFMEAKREAARLAAAEARARAAVARAEAEEKRAAAAERVRTERAAAQEARTRAAAEQAAAKEARARQLAAEQDPERSVIPWLMRLGARADEARRAAAASDAAMPEASLEERLRFALSTMAPAHRRAPAGMAMAG